MKYMISWFDRPKGSVEEYESAQQRILDVFGQWKAPDNLKIELERRAKPQAYDTGGLAGGIAQARTAWLAGVRTDAHPAALPPLNP